MWWTSHLTRFIKIGRLVVSNLLSLHHTAMNVSTWLIKCLATQVKFIAVLHYFDICNNLGILLVMCKFLFSISKFIVLLNIHYTTDGSRNTRKLNLKLLCCRMTSTKQYLKCEYYRFDRFILFLPWHYFNKYRNICDNRLNSLYFGLRYLNTIIGVKWTQEPHTSETKLDWIDWLFFWNC